RIRSPSYEGFPSRSPSFADPSARTADTAVHQGLSAIHRRRRSTPAVVETFSGPDECRGFVRFRKEARRGFKYPEVPLSAFPIDPAAMSQDIEHHLEGFEPLPVGLTVAMSAM